MPVALREDTEGRVLEVTLSGKLTKNDYEQFGPAAETMIKDHGTIRILCIMHDFHGWTLGRSGRTSSSTGNTSPTSSASPSSATAAGSKGWPRFASHSPRPRFAIST